MADAPRLNPWPSNQTIIGVHDDFLAKFVDQARTLQSELGLIMLDLDGFKQINDTWGHQQGDEVLEKVAEILRSQTRQAYVVCRRGGDEFVILLPGVSVKRGLSLAENVRKRIEEGFPIDSAGIKITGSLGFASFIPDDSVGDMLIRADRNLYLAKDRGRNRVVYEND